MNRNALLLASSLLILIAGCNKRNTIGNGKVVFQNRDIKGYNSISINGAYDVYLKNGSSESLIVEADENLMSVIKTELRGNTLEVFNSENIIRSKDLKLIITNPNLNNLNFSGAVQLTSDTGLTFKNLAINISGIGRIDLALNAESLTSVASGGADITFRGKVNTFNVTITGTGSVDAENLESKECDVVISGLGKARVCAEKKLNVNISGLGKVDYKGNPHINQVISGAGNDFTFSADGPFAEDFRASWRTVMNYVWHGNPNYTWNIVHF